MKTFLLLLTVALAVPSAVSAAPASFAGTWKTERRCKPYTVILTQDGDKVTGTYSPGNGKIFNGVVIDDKLLSFRWTEDGAEGFGEFLMNWDGKGFTGTSSQVKQPNGMIVAWKTYSPPVTSFAGVWQTTIDGRNDISLTMLQSGDQVTGSYQGNGKLEGTVSGIVLRFKWRSDSGSGSGRFVMERPNNSFSGTYNRGTNPDDVDNTWAGRLPPRPEGGPGPCDPLGAVYAYPKDPRPEGWPGPKGNMTEAEYLKKLAEYEERQKNAPVAFDGVWQIKAGEQFVYPQLLLQQPTSDKVLGHLFAGRPDMGVIKDGIVERATLRFTVWRPNPAAILGRYEPDLPMGTGEFVMNADGKSFKGTILGATITGTRIAR